MGGNYFIKIKPRCSSEPIYVTRLKSHPTGCPENIAGFEMFLFSLLYLSFLFTLQPVGFSKEQLCCYYIHFLYFVILSESSDCVFSGYYCGSKCNKKIFVTFIVDTVKSTVFRVAMLCILVHLKVSDSLLGQMLVASSPKISVLFYEAT
jgi:hypothetical protein